MTAADGILALVGDPALRDDVDRSRRGLPASRRPRNRAVEPQGVGRRGGCIARCAGRPPLRRPCAAAAWPRRPGRPRSTAGRRLGSRDSGRRPTRRHAAGPGRRTVAELSDAVEAARDDGRRGAVIAVIGGRGGAGASVFATAWRTARPTHCWSTPTRGAAASTWCWARRRKPGLRWPDLALQGGRLNLAALRDALPRRHGVSVLSGGRAGGDIDAAPLARGDRRGQSRRRHGHLRCAAAIDRRCRNRAGCRRSRGCGRPCRCAVMRRRGGDRPVGVGDQSQCRPRGARARRRAVCGRRCRTRSSVCRCWRRCVHSRTWRVVLERGGLRLRRRSPLAAAARRVLTVLHQHPAVNAA